MNTQNQLSIHGRIGFRSRSAFSLIEILVVMALLTVIIFGLLAMFSQTQKAFRTGLAQVDVLEGGRVTTDLISGELAQMTPSRQMATNFYLEIPNYTPLLQPLPGSSFSRLNLCNDLFFVTRRNQEWIGIGYFVRETDPQTGNLRVSPVGTGTLYRFETNAPALSGRTPANLLNEFLAARGSEFRATRIMDGVVHFKVRAYNTNGFWVTQNLHNPADNSYISYSPVIAPGEITLCAFYGNAVPAAVEVELGILESRAWERFKSLPDAASQYRYITNQTGRVHIFRQRVPIRSVDPLAYR